MAQIARLLLLFATTAHAYRPAHTYRPAKSAYLPRRARVLIACDGSPSDSGDDDDGMATAVEDFVCRSEETDAEALTNQLLRLCAATDRGQAATAEDKTQLSYLVSALEGLCPPPDVSGGQLDGTWRLVYAGCAAYRSSPFFWAFKKLAADVDSPVTPGNAEDGSLAASIFAVTDGIPFKSIGPVRQTLSGTGGPDGELKSQVELKLSIFDALLPPQSSIMTTTASAGPDASDAACLALSVLKTEVKESSIASLLPFVDDLLSFDTAPAFAALKPGSAEVTMRTTFLSDRLRISRAAEGGPSDVFAFVNEEAC